MDDNPVEWPIDGVLDLHSFRPKEVSELLNDYIDACLAKGILDLRIIHGKGTGALRELVHSKLGKHPRVLSYQLDANWGATVVRLRA